jgi:hypothetical protein
VDWLWGRLVSVGATNSLVELCYCYWVSSIVHRPSSIGYRLSSIGYRLSAIGYLTLRGLNWGGGLAPWRMSSAAISGKPMHAAVCHQCALSIGRRLSAIGYRLSAIGYRGHPVPWRMSNAAISGKPMHAAVYHQCTLSISYRLSAIGYQLSGGSGAVTYEQRRHLSKPTPPVHASVSTIGYRPSAIGYRLSAIGAPGRR